MRALSDFLWRSLRADMFHQVACLPVNLYINCSSVTSVEHSWNDELFLFYNWRQEKRWSVRSEELYCLPTSVAYSDRSFHFFLHVDKLQQHANCLHTFAFGSNIVSIIGSQYRVTWWQLSHQVWQVKWHYRNFPRYTRIELTMPFLFFFFLVNLKNCSVSCQLRFSHSNCCTTCRSFVVLFVIKQKIEQEGKKVILHVFFRSPTLMGNLSAN